MAGGAPIGNQNAVKARRWQQALFRALARASNKDIDAGLDQAADKVVSAAIGGDKWAIDHLADRTDGKAAQTIDANFDAGAGLLAVLTGFSKRDDPPVA